MVKPRVGNGPRLDAETLKQFSAGHCRDILGDVCGLASEHLDGRHRSCPKCGGTDRFRAFADVNETGGLFCNQCHSQRNGDVFSSIQWLTGCTFPAALDRVANWLEGLGISTEDDCSSATAGSNESSRPVTTATKPKAAKRTFPSWEKAAEWLWGILTWQGKVTEECRPSRAWGYRNADGDLVGAVVRWDPEGREKIILPLAKTDAGWICSGMPAPRPLANLPGILAAETVWVAEGEKAAAAAETQLGVIATTPAHGAQSPAKTDWSPLDGKRVVILPDNDEAGDGYTCRVVQLIRRDAPSATVEVKRLRDDWPEIPPKGDIVDWLEQFDTAEPGELIRRLEAIPNCVDEYVQPTTGVDSAAVDSDREAKCELFFEGERVRCGDRGNFGEVVADSGGSHVTVHFQSPDGNEATKEILRGQLISIDHPDKGGAPALELSPFSAWEVIDVETPLDEELIEGLIRVRETGSIIAATKTGKSWLGLGLAVSVASGRRWLSRSTRKGDVLLIDNELNLRTLRHRLKTVLKAMGVRREEDLARLQVASLRGLDGNISAIEKALARFRWQEYSLVIIDAKYRCYGDLDENNNSDQANFHNTIDRIVARLGASVLLVHHSTKGEQGNKSTVDVGAGGGSQARAVDVHLTIRPHQASQFCVMDAAVRSFPPVDPQTLQFEFPLWHLAPSVEPVLKLEHTRGDCRQEAKDAQAVSDLSDVFAEFPGQPLTRYELHKQFGGGKERLDRLIRLGLSSDRFRRAGTRKARNGGDAELFVLAGDYHVQHSEESGDSVSN